MVQQIIETAMQEDDETTATQLQTKLADHGIYISLATILRNRRLLGWVYRGSAYFQLIHIVNKQKSLEWAKLIHLMMSYGVMKLAYNLKLTVVFVAEKKA